MSPISASATDSTPEAGDSLPYNSAQIKGLVFDTSVNQIKVGWSVNPAQAESLQVGILYSTDAMPKASTGQQQVIDVTAAQDSVYLAVSGGIMFDRTYYVSLWLRRSGGEVDVTHAAGHGQRARAAVYMAERGVLFKRERHGVRL